MSRLRPSARTSLLASFFLVLAGVALFSLTSRAVSASPRQALSKVWERAYDAGAYGFVTDIRQSTVPQSTVLNVGRTSKERSLHLEGETNLPERQMSLTLWSQGGNVLDAASGIQVRIEGDRAFARSGVQDWQEVNNLIGSLAPQGDFMAYLSAARDVVEQETTSRGGVPLTRYTFRIDGPRYAAYVRTEMERYLLEQGELPPGISLDVSKSYAQMQGEGELWVGTDGLPVRQVLHLRFPPSPDDQVVRAEISTDFAFPSAGASRVPPFVLGGLQAFERLGQRLPVLLLALVAGLVCIVCWRSPRFRAALAVVVIVSLVFSPLLQTARAVDFVQRQAARAQEAEVREQESDLQLALRALSTGSDHQPNVDPLAGEPPQSPVSSGASALWDRPGLAAAEDDSGSGGDDDDDCDPDAQADTDGDGLTDGNECVLGTNDEEEDSDGDGLTDGEEVTGFDYAGQTWYADPLEMDSNKDGLDDGTEWNTGRAEGDPPPDLDGDDTPDLFDRDNDGDGVPDRLDISPYYAGDTTYTGDEPFELVLDGLTESRPTFVEFQLRPTDPDHLWYAFNVLDWPDGDDQGQLQDADGATFYDLDDSTDRSPNDNGDVKLVPMLEIKISGEPDNLPDEDDLDAYGISVQDLDDDGETQVAYVPLQMIVDQQGDERVAFSGKMRYLPAEQWGRAHQVRLVWAVHMLVDVCAEYKDGRCVEYEEMNQTQIVHVYDDNWTLTGLDVREEHGTDLDVIYEDPAVDGDLDDDSMLLYLTYGLERTFLAGSDCEDIDDKGTSAPEDDVCLDGDGERDITVDEIYRRWSHSSNGGVSDTERWSLEDIFTVVTYTYETIDEALYTTAVTETVRILDDQFTAHHPITPTILFAREERFRGVNLDQDLEDGGIVQWSDEEPRRLTLTLSEDDVPVETVAGLNWAPYRYQDGGWEAYPLEEYWDELHERYTAAFAGEYDDEDSPDEVRGGAAIMGQLYYMSIYLGVSVGVQSGKELLTQNEYQTYDKPVWSRISGFGGTAVVFIVNRVLMRNFYQSSLALRALYYFMKKERFFTAHELGGTAFRAIKGKVMNWWSGHKWRLGAAGVAAAVLLGLIITGAVFLAKGFLADKPAARITAAVIVGALLFAGTVLLPIVQTINLVKTFQSTFNLSASAAAGRVLGKSAKLIGMTKKAAVIGLVISIGIAWGIFIYALVKEDIPAGSVAFDMLLAQTIAATIVAILMFALSLTIVGTIIVAIISLVDIILVIAGVEWTITGAITSAITKALFAYEIAIDLKAKNLIELGRLDTSIVHPELGLVAGNEMEFSTTLTTTVTHRNPGDWRAKAYLWLYSKDQIRSTTFKYGLDSGELDLSASRNQQKGDWEVADHHKYGGHTMYRAEKTDDLATTTTLEAGINRKVNLKLTTAYAIPGVECWTLYWWIPIPPILFPIPICFNKGIDGSEPTDMGSSIVFDVLPATLDAFVDTASWAAKIHFRDADGDGLLARRYKGNDPDDSRWDTDGDGLSDAWEMERSAAPADEGGQFFDPRDADTDGDGLSDRGEVWHRTDPNRTDTDGDGLSDPAEAVDGWQFTYDEGKSVRVYSDPLHSDWDGDGMDDLFERTLHTCPGCDPLENRYHPKVWNTSPVGLYTEVADADGIVRPGQIFVYTTTVQNNLNPDLWMRGDTTLSADPLTGGPYDMIFDIARDQEQSLRSELMAPAGTGNRDVDLETTLNARLHTPSVWAWDRPRNAQHDTATGASPVGVAISPVEGWTVPYVLASVEFGRVYVYTASAEKAHGSGAIAIGSTVNESNGAPGLACNDQGTCLVVWSSHNSTTGTDNFRRRRIVPTLQVDGSVRTVTAPSGQETAGGAIATDGDGFLAVWLEGASGNWTLRAIQLDAAGAQVGAIQSLDAGNLGSADVTWAYDRYLVIWTRDGDLQAASVDGSAVEGYDLPATAAVEGLPRVAYDALGRHSLLAYWARENNKYSVRVRLFDGESAGDEIRLSGTSLSSGATLALSADPVNGGWVVSWSWSGTSTMMVQAVGMNGELRGTKQEVQSAEGAPLSVDLACAQPRPVVQLLLDEDVGATTFDDASGFGNEGTCVDNSYYDCPTAGVEGQEGNGVYFDGNDDEIHVAIDLSETDYAVSLWFKTTRGTAGLLEAADNRIYGGFPHHDRDVYVQNGRVCARIGLGNSEGTERGDIICTSDQGYNDGNWHHVVHTFGGAVGAQRLYVDGQLKRTGERDRSDFSGQNKVRIGYTANIGSSSSDLYLNGVIDQVTVYPRALSEGEVRDAYQAALAIYAFDEAEGATTMENITRNGYALTCSGDACPTAGVEGRAYAALEFDGENDALHTSGDLPLDGKSLTVSFWARRGRTDRGETIISQGAPASYEALLIGFRSNGRFACGFFDTDLVTTNAYNDTEWHHWTCTYDIESGKRTIYRDGNRVAQDTPAQGYQGAGQLYVGRGLEAGGRTFTGRIDELAIWRKALTASEVELLYDQVKAKSASLVECARPRTVQGDDRLLQHRLAVREATTFLGKATQERTDTITVDATRPGSEITSLSNGDVINTTGTLIIGGEARDNTFVDRVQIRVNDGPWQDADGVETWSYSLDTTLLGDGTYTIRSRAIDAGGNVQSPVHIVAVDIDRSPMQLSAGAPPLRAERDAQDRWVVPLQGAFVDAHPDTVEVLLEGADGSSGLGWQVADLGNSHWSIDYILSGFDNAEIALGDPTGVYTLSLRAWDVPGNHTSSMVYPPPVRLDNTSPGVELTYPLTDTVILTDTALLITGIVTDSGSVASGIGRVEVAFVDSESDPPVFDWADAVLGQPGAATSTWSFPMSQPLEGFYDLYVRATDGVGNVNEQQSTWHVWRGVVDTQPPLVDASVRYIPFGTVPDVTYSRNVTCLARDINLRGESFGGCPCPPTTWQVTTYDQVSPWYRETFTDTTHLYEIRAACHTVGQIEPVPVVEACDMGGRCSQTSIADTVEPPPILYSTIMTPTDGDILTTTAPFDVHGEIYALGFVQNLTVTVNGAIWHTALYGGGLTQSWTQTFSPPDEGRYTFLSLASDQNGDVQTIINPVTVTVDATPPSMPTFETTVLTTTHRSEGGMLYLRGVVTDAVEVRRVQANLNEGEWHNTSHDGEIWRWPWPEDESDADPRTYSVSVRATDYVSRTSQVTETITFDMVPPSAMTVTLSYEDASLVRHAVEPGQTVTDSHTLVVEWTASSDGSGMNGYTVGWTESPTDTTGLPFVFHGMIYEATQAIGEARTVYAHTVALDVYGNPQHQVEGPVYVDAPRTPDIIGRPGDLSYHGWEQSGCSELGIDRRVSSRAPDGASLSEDQHLYATWNADALRLAWVGANWNAEGDLFVYLDTAPGGAETLYDPYPATMTNTTIYLPGNLPSVDTSGWPAFDQMRQLQLSLPLEGWSMQADYVLWVEDGSNVTLLSWNGGTWVVDTILDPDLYQVDVASGRTDLYLPFSLIGISNPALSALNMIAVASEEDALRLWATMPHRNLVDSSLAVNPLSAAQGEHIFMLVHPFTWANLGPGLCPNDPLEALTGEAYVDSALHATIDVEPVGTTFALMQEDLYAEWVDLFLKPGPGSEYLDAYDRVHRPLGAGSVVTYTLRVENRGTMAAEAVQAYVSAYYALSLPGATQDPVGYREVQTIDLGSIAPGAAVTHVLTGVVSGTDNWRYQRCLTVDGLPESACSTLLRWASLDSLVFDSVDPALFGAGTIPIYPPVEWLWAEHAVDIDPPLPVGIDGPRSTVGPGVAAVRGYAVDPSGTPLVEVEVRDGLGTTTLICPDETPDDGRWDCEWAVSGSDGDLFDLRARAVDALGHASGWTSPWRTVILDSTPPTVTLDGEVQLAVQDQIIGPDGYLLEGTFADTYSTGAIEVCRQEGSETTCDPAGTILSTQTLTESAHVYDDVSAVPLDLSGALCGGGEVTRTIWVSDSFIIGDTNLGLNVEHPHRDELIVDLFSPVGTHVRVVYGRANTAETYANYDVWLDDAAEGNLHNSADDDLGEPLFDRSARPDSSLDAFAGEDAQGVWTMRICDLVPGVNDGRYNRARLALTEQGDAVAWGGTWHYALPTPAGVDGVMQTVTVYGADALGNRMPDPISLSYVLDVVAPEMAVTQVITRVFIDPPTVVLSGRVTDGDEVNGVYVRVDPPDGASYRDRAIQAGSDWAYAPHFAAEGTYILWLEAYDRAGNAAVSGPYEVQVLPLPIIYLPIVMRDAHPQIQWPLGQSK